MSYTPPTNPSAWHTPTAGKLSQSDDHQQYPPGHPENARPILTQDEIRVLKECNKESFYYRCVPLATMFSGLAYIAMKAGVLNKSPYFGYAPKMFVGAVMGYIGGKLSYQGACAEKVMQLSNSQLANVLRKRKGLPTIEDSNTEPGFAYTAPSKEFQQDNTMFDERRPDLSEHEEGGDSYQNVKDSLSPYSETDQISEHKFTSYDDLRRDNRDEYMVNRISEKYKRENGSFRSPSAPSSFPGSSISDPPYSSSPLPEERGSGPAPRRDPSFHKKNKYGDVLD